MRIESFEKVTSLAAMLLVLPIRNWLKALRHAPDRAALLDNPLSTAGFG